MTALSTSEAAFVAKTHAALRQLVLDARSKRRQHDKPGCACRHCSDLALIHARIDDHLGQLFGDAEPPTLSPTITPVLAQTALSTAIGNPAADICSCTELRMKTPAGVLLCPTCDHPRA